MAYSKTWLFVQEPYNYKETKARSLCLVKTEMLQSN